jgi:hypothetical protein
MSTKTARVLVGLFALGAIASSCHKGTYLEVVFKGAGLPPVNHIHFSLTLDGGGVSSGDLPGNAAAGNVVALPASAAFQLDDVSGALAISAVAFDETNTKIAEVDTTTTIMHDKTWTVTLDFAGGASDAGTVADAVDDGPTLVTITDGSLADGATGCVAATVLANESVSLDYNSSGSDMDSGNMLWAYLGPNERLIGWMKFGVRFVPRTARVTKATLNLWMSQATGGVPLLLMDYSSVDGWTRKSKATDISVDSVISTGGPYVMPNAAGASTPYTLDVNHNWALDFAASDGTVTLGIENMAPLAAAVNSRVEFYGVNHTADPDLTRPTLDLEFCP